MIDGLKDGLKELGFEEGRQYVLHIRDVKGDPKALEPAARTLEQEKVDLIYSLSTSITLAVRRATTSVPIVFYAGTGFCCCLSTVLAPSPPPSCHPEVSNPQHVQLFQVRNYTPL